MGRLRQICFLVWVSILWGMLGSITSLLSPAPDWFVFPLAAVGGVAMAIYINSGGTDGN